MRSGPATQTAFARECSVLPGSPRKGDEARSWDAFPKEHTPLERSANVRFAASRKPTDGSCRSKTFEGRNALGFSESAEAHPRNFPRQFTLENRRIPSASAPRQSAQNISRMHFEHSAASRSNTQQRTNGWLCRNCGGTGLLVESTGKAG
jgi:hypothetical protein